MRLYLYNNFNNLQKDSISDNNNTNNKYNIEEKLQIQKKKIIREKIKLISLLLNMIKLKKKMKITK